MISFITNTLFKSSTALTLSIWAYSAMMGPTAKFIVFMAPTIICLLNYMFFMMPMYDLPWFVFTDAPVEPPMEVPTMMSLLWDDMANTDNLLTLNSPNHFIVNNSLTDVSTNTLVSFNPSSINHISLENTSIQDITALIHQSTINNPWLTYDNIPQEHIVEFSGSYKIDKNGCITNSNFSFNTNQIETNPKNIIMSSTQYLPPETLNQSQIQSSSSTELLINNMNSNPQPIPMMVYVSSDFPSTIMETASPTSMDSSPTSTGFPTTHSPESPPSNPVASSPETHNSQNISSPSTNPSSSIEFSNNLSLSSHEELPSSLSVSTIYNLSDISMDFTDPPLRSSLSDTNINYPSSEMVPTNYS